MIAFSALDGLLTQMQRYLGERRDSLQMQHLCTHSLSLLSLHNRVWVSNKRKSSRSRLNSSRKKQQYITKLRLKFTCFSSWCSSVLSMLLLAWFALSMKLAGMDSMCAGMSLCQECFKGGDHEGHDVVRFFSREGGACDCGNDDVLKCTG